MVKMAMLSLLVVTIWTDRTSAAPPIELTEPGAYAEPVDFSLDATHAFVVYARHSAPVWGSVGENYDVVLAIYARVGGEGVTKIDASQLWGGRLHLGPFPMAKVVPYGDGVVVAIGGRNRTMYLAQVDRHGNVGSRRMVEDFLLASLGRHREFIWASTFDRVVLFDERLDLRYEWFPGGGLLAVESFNQETVALHGVLDPATGLYAGTVRWVRWQDVPTERMTVPVPVPVAIFPVPRLLVWSDGLSLVTHDGAADWHECRLALAHGEFQCAEPAWARDLKALSPWYQPLLQVVQDDDGYVATAMNGCGIWSRRYDRSHSTALRQLTVPSGSSDLGIVQSFLAREWSGDVFLLTSAVLTTGGWDPEAKLDAGMHHVVLQKGTLLASPPVQPTPRFEGCPAWTDGQFAQDLTAHEVRSCIAKGADPNAEFNCGAWTRPLAMAALEDNEAAVRALIEAGAEVNVQDEEGNAALHNAARHAHSEGTLRALLDGGADATLRNRNGKLAWDYARDNAALKDTDIARRLLGTD